MVTLIAWIATILFFLIVIVIILSVIQFNKIKNLKSVICSLQEVVDVPKEKDHSFIDLTLIERKILTGTNKDLTIYAQKLYWANDTKSISNNFDKVALLDKKVVAYGLIRVSALEDNYDLSKFLPPVVTILTALLAAYSQFFQKVIFKDMVILQFGFPLIIIFGCFFYISKLIGDTRSQRGATIFFKSLLQYAKEQQKKI